MRKIVFLIFLFIGLNAMAQEKVRVHNGEECYVTTMEYLTFDVEESDEVLSITDLHNEIEGLKNDTAILRKAYVELKEVFEYADSTIDPPVVEYFRPAVNPLLPTEAEVQWSVQRAEYVKISVDGTCVYNGENNKDAKYFNALETIGNHDVRLFAHNVNGRIYRNFHCFTLDPTIKPTVKYFYVSDSDTLAIHWATDCYATAVDIMINNYPFYSGKDTVGVINCDWGGATGDVYSFKIIAHNIAGDTEASFSYSFAPPMAPRIGYFYPDRYSSKSSEKAPWVYWSVENATSVEIWIDDKCVLVTQDAISKFRFSKMEAAGTHIVRLVAHNVTGDAENSFAYRVEK